MNKILKLIPAILSVSTLVVAVPITSCASQHNISTAVDNESTTCLITFSSDNPDVSFTGNTKIKIKKGKTFGSIDKPGTFLEDYAFKYWVYGMNYGQHVIGEQVQPSDVFDTNCIINPYFEPSPIIVTDFTKDSWTQVIFWANQGIDLLHKHYSENCARNTDFPGTLIGLERSVFLNGVEHKVRVVDENHDKLSYDNANAALTFEFKDLVSDSNGNSLAAVWNWYADVPTTTPTYSSHNYNYPVSTLNEALNSSTSINSWYEKGSTSRSTTYKSSVLTMMKNSLDDETKTLAANITPVTKRVGYLDYKRETVWTVGHTDSQTTTYNTKLFVPVYDEIINETPVSDYAKNEGALYTYYKKKYFPSDRYKHQVNISEINESSTIDKTTIGSSYPITIYAGTNYSSDPNSFGGFSWLASPYVSTETSSSTFTSFGLTPDSQLVGFGNYNYALNIAPCFCIGHEEIPDPVPPTSIKWSQATWSDIKERTNWYENSKQTSADWTEFCSFFTNDDGTPFTSNADFLGKTIPVQLKHQDLNGNGVIDDGEYFQTVRIIGTAADGASYQVNKVASTAKKAALTFDFVDLISDENGYSIGYQWNDSSATGTNYSYSTSTLRESLNGLTSTSGHYHKYGNTSYTQGLSVLKMLPDDLQSSITETTKYVGTYTSAWAQGVVTNKLFLPTYKEITGSTGSYTYESGNNVYKFYKDSGLTAFMKLQLSSSYGSSKSVTSLNGISTTSYAGYKYSSTTSCYQWLMSPNSYGSKYATHVTYSGGLSPSQGSYVYKYARAIAPIFCI